jgi:hypothetical protein
MGIFSPSMLRQVFATHILFGEPQNVARLWDIVKQHAAQDYAREIQIGVQQPTPEPADINEALMDVLKRIRNISPSTGSESNQEQETFGLPQVDSILHSSRVIRLNQVRQERRLLRQRQHELGVSHDVDEQRPVRIQRAVAHLHLTRSPAEAMEQFNVGFTRLNEGQRIVFFAVAEGFVEQFGVGRTRERIALEYVQRNHQLPNNLHITSNNTNTNINVYTDNTSQQQEQSRLIAERHNRAGFVAYVDAPGGCGKTFTANVIFLFVNALGYCYQATANNGLVASQFVNGATIYSRFRIPVGQQAPDMQCNLYPSSDVGQEMRERLGLLFIDEIWVVDVYNLDAIHRALCEITRCPRNNQAPMGRIPTLIAGDPRQTLAVIPGEGRAGIVMRLISQSESFR